MQIESLQERSWHSSNRVQFSQAEPGSELVLGDGQERKQYCRCPVHFCPTRLLLSTEGPEQYDVKIVDNSRKG